MKDRIIKIPKIFQELHGEATTLSNILIIYFTGLVAAAIFSYQLIGQPLETWKIILFGIIIFDVAGGVVSNLSTSTNIFYHKAPNSKRVFFLLLHVLHTLGLFIVFPECLGFLVFLTLYTISSALIVNWVTNSEYQQNLAAALLVLGISIIMFFKMDVLVLYMVAPMFMIKLMLGFSVKRPAFSRL